MLSDEAFDRLDRFEQIAMAAGITLLELAVAWLLAQPLVGPIICGATKPSQIRTNIAAAACKLDQAAISQLSAALAYS